MREAPSRLFHSIVAVGLSLTAACGAAGTTSDEAGAKDATTPPDGSPTDGRAHDARSDAPVDALAHDTGGDRDATSNEASMPSCPCRLDASCAPRSCPNATGMGCDDAGCCFPCYV